MKSNIVRNLGLSLVIAGGLSLSQAQAEEPGKALYDAKCAKCHGLNGDGKGRAGKSLDHKPTVFTDKSKLSNDAKMAKAIKGGGEAIGQSKDMEKYPDLTDQQIKDLVSYIHTLAK